MSIQKVVYHPSFILKNNNKPDQIMQMFLKCNTGVFWKNPITTSVAVQGRGM
jgi:hypothetical protein